MPGGRSDYDHVVQVIDYLRTHQQQQPGLATLAAHAGVSESQLQRVFSRWVGVSPKRFLQHLTLQQALPVLEAGGSVLDAALDAGLSGSSRLHDLLVHCEAVTPGEAAARGAGLTIRHGFTDTLFGDALIATTGRGICYLAFREPDTRSGMLEDLLRRWPRAQHIEDERAAARLATRIFTGSAPQAPLHLHLHGTNFQIQVWRALLRIPSGQTSTYGRVAGAVGRNGSGRAVGNAVGANPVAWLIPCHRVLRQDGAIGGYRWGEQRKRVMLAREAALREVRSAP